ncbi:unnamed protein product, partial [Urochloa humidicola]
AGSARKSYPTSSSFEITRTDAFFLFLPCPEKSRKKPASKQGRPWRSRRPRGSSPPPPSLSSGDGSDLQSALAEWTGQRTVPNVFVKGERIGGCDATMAMHNGGKLVPLLTEAGAIANAKATAIPSL